MPREGYREYLRSNYKSVKAELQKSGRPHAKKDVYGALRSRYYDKKDEISSGIKDPNPVPVNSEKAKITTTDTKEKPKLNLKAFANLYKRLIKL